MGLDCSAYEKVTLIKKISLKNMQARNWKVPPYGEDDSVHFLFNYDEFKDRSDGLEVGLYRSSGKTFEFRAGSYGGYGEYRQLLAKIGNTTPEAVWSDSDRHKNVPFFEQINFADNEGFLGPKTCAALLADYIQHRKTAEKALSEWFHSYTEWMEALKLAANGGVIRFH
jgi:hypothetical protein